MVSSALSLTIWQARLHLWFSQDSCLPQGRKQLPGLAKWQGQSDISWRPEKIHKLSNNYLSTWEQIILVTKAFNRNRYDTIRTGQTFFFFLRFNFFPRCTSFCPFNFDHNCIMTRWWTQMRAVRSSIPTNLFAWWAVSKMAFVQFTFLMMAFSRSSEY